MTKLDDSKRRRAELAYLEFRRRCTVVAQEPTIAGRCDMKPIFDERYRKSLARALADDATTCAKRKRGIWQRATYQLADDLPRGGGEVAPIKSDHELARHGKFKDTYSRETKDAYAAASRSIRDRCKDAANVLKDQHLAKPYPEGAEDVLRAMEGRPITEDEFAAVARKYGDSYQVTRRLNAMAEASGIHSRILHRVDMQEDGIKRAGQRAESVASTRFSSGSTFNVLGRELEANLEADLVDILDGGNGGGMMGAFTPNRWPCKLEESHDYGIYSDAEDYGVSGGPTRLD